ncbi:CotH kinase family protein [Nocardioides baculatus]|uniref:CotH kinase family protein n=1 Tax=Nocardioides baculatus TaxID=2801337 RepID=A0ABS1L659_9ACTN|nr:CotH kinase family protein [Nocardioides baculatus]MBL0747095.1 CotH kinase family protein [Nocardioides baculatus]
MFEHIVTRVPALCAAVAVSVTAALLAPLSPGSAAEPDPAAAAAVGWPPAPPTQLVIDTLGAPVGREDYVPGTVTLDGVTHTTEVRGRGNSSWSWAKKPYKLKLEEDAALVGDDAHDEWVLLANYGDRSGLRTATAFAIAAQTRLAWTPKFRFVDVVLNGQSQGLYMLTEQVEEGGDRVDLPDDGYLLEFNKRYLRDGEPGFRTKRGSAIAFKDPDEVTRKQRRQVRGAVTRFEKVLYGPDFADPKIGYRNYVDVRRLIDWYLVEELFANQDSNFQSSVNFSWIPGKRFVFGPVWDFDLSAGTKWKASTPPEGWYTRTGASWMSRLLQDPGFARRVKKRWQVLRPTVDAVLAQLPQAAATLAPSAEADWDLWHAGDADLEWTRHARTRKGEVEFVGDWLAGRAHWMSRNEVRVGDLRGRTTERERTVWVPVDLQDPMTTAVDVSWSVTGVSAEAGVDFVAAEGQFTFAPGEVRHYVPVRILDDDVTEERELVAVTLRAASNGVLVGSPGIGLVVIDANKR